MIFLKGMGLVLKETGFFFSNILFFPFLYAWHLGQGKNEYVDPMGQPIHIGLARIFGVVVWFLAILFFLIALGHKLFL